MSLIHDLERRLRPLSIPKLTNLLIACQVIGYVVTLSNPDFFDRVSLDPQRLLQGEWWRVVSCLVASPANRGEGIVFTAILLYAFWFMGTILESHWGTVWYNLYVYCSHIGILAYSLIAQTPVHHVVPLLGNAVLLAFGFLYSEVPITFYFFPVKAKFVAVISWIFVIAQALSGNYAPLAAAVSFFVFFGRRIVRGTRYGHRRAVWKTQSQHDRGKPLHTCVVCGVTEKSDPTMEFRYCSKCSVERCFCIDHIRDHEHQ